MLIIRCVEHPGFCRCCCCVLCRSYLFGINNIRKLSTARITLMTNSQNPKYFRLNMSIKLKSIFELLNTPLWVKMGEIGFQFQSLNLNLYLSFSIHSFDWLSVSVSVRKRFQDRIRSLCACYSSFCRFSSLFSRVVNGSPISDYLFLIFC